jgi:hypothetical protein
MSFKTLIIYKNLVLHKILEEISDNINFKVVYKENIDLSVKDFSNYLILTSKKVLENHNQLLVGNFPIKISKLLENINIAFLKQEFNFQSNIKIGKYELDLNSRKLSLNNINLDLTEMESNIILFLNNSNEPVNVKKLQKNVWKHVPDLETHTVETHIYRLRKKIKNKFQDDNFIESLKNGYNIC